MCGRYAIKTSVPELARILEAESDLDSAPRYNVAPTQSAPVCRVAADRRRIDLLRWGLVPAWADDPRIGNRMINARAETAATKPAFRAAFRRRRCVVPADGYYEWQRLAGARKQPWFVHGADERPLALAGLWERREREGEVLESFAILTTGANASTAAIHDRMPVILDADGVERWLAGDAEPGALLGPCPAQWLAAYPVSTFVNSPRNDDSRCIEPLA